MNRREFDDAVYRFFRHIQDQIEQEDGWTQAESYNPEIDAYEFELFTNSLGEPSNAARWHDLLARFTGAATEQEDSDG